MGKTLKKRLAMVMTVAMLTATVPQTTFASDYTNHWASGAIAKWESKGLVKGYEDGTFKPKNVITRAEMAQILCRLFGLEQTEKAKTYSDVTSDKWYAEAVALVSDAGLMYEVEGTTTFRPNAAITREEAAYALATAYKVAGEARMTFEDVDAIADWAEEAVEAMFAKGYIKGDNKGYFNPQGTLTRAELVTMIDNMTVDVISVAGIYSDDVAGNLIVNTRDVELKDMVIEGNLYLAEGIGDGDITLDNIEVKGQVIVEGGGINSIKSKNSKYHEKFVVSAENPVRVVVEGDAVKVEAMPGTTVTLTGSFADVIVAPNVNMTVKDATVETIIVAPATNPNDKVEVPVIKVEGTAKVDKVQADAPVEVKGEGTVGSLVVNTEGVKIEQTPGKVEIGEGQDKDLTVNIGGKDQTQDSLDKDTKPESKPETDKPSDGGNSNDNNSGNGNSGHTCNTNKKVNVRGRVHYKGEGLEYASVEIFDRKTNDWITSVFSDEDGYYSFYVPACSNYRIQVWFQDGEGYGYYADNIQIPTTHNNTTVNIEVEKKHVVNFTVVDKNNVPVRGIEIVSIINGKKDGWSNTDNFGEAVRYLWQEDVTYGFEFYANNKLVHTIPESIQVGEDYKQDITVRLDTIGLNDTIVGEVIKDGTDERLANIVVDLCEVTPDGPHSTSTRRVATTVTDANGVYRFKTPDTKKTYVVEVHTKTEDGTYYASQQVDARFTPHTGLFVKQAYGVNIKVVDKNNKPMPWVRVSVEYPRGGYSSTNTQADGSTDIFNYYTEPGLHVVKAQIDNDVLAHGLQIEEGKYNYEVIFKFENKVEDRRIANVAVNASSVQVGDRIIPVDRVHISAPLEEGNSEKGSWGAGNEVRDGKATIVIPAEHQNEMVTIKVLGPNDEILYTEENVSFTEGVLNHSIDLQNLPTYQLTGQILLNQEVTTGASLTINMDGWGYTPTEVGTPSAHNGSYTQDNLIEGSYLVRAEVTTGGALYVSTNCIDVDADTQLDIELREARKVKVKVEDEAGKALANVAVEVNFNDNNGRQVSYTTFANAQGEFELLEALEDEQKIWFWVRRYDNVSYDTLEGRFLIQSGDNTFIVKAQVVSEDN